MARKVILLGDTPDDQVVVMTYADFERMLAVLGQQDRAKALLHVEATPEMMADLREWFGDEIPTEA